ncbi:MAG: hypothetical protein PF445_05090, partial [Melioribacteraceae bacterium]|nr:hypothetical protein [Melioribacteraceae bacterium]
NIRSRFKNNISLLTVSPTVKVSSLNIINSLVRSFPEITISSTIKLSFPTFTSVVTLCANNADRLIRNIRTICIIIFFDIKIKFAPPY